MGCETRESGQRNQSHYWQVTTNESRYKMSPKNPKIEQAINETEQTATVQPDYLTAAMEAFDAAESAVESVTTATAGLPEAVRAAAINAAQAESNAAATALVAAQTRYAREAERANETAAIESAVAAMPETYRETARAAMLQALETKYAPAPIPTVQDAASTRKQPSERTLAANAAVAADPDKIASAAPFWTAWQHDLPTLRCSCAQLAGTRFAGLVALAPSGAGVANVAEWHATSRAVRLFLRDTIGLRESGVGVIDPKWLAARADKYQGDADSGPNCFKASGAVVALYADGRFRLALPGTANVRPITTDNGAWAIFNGSKDAAPASSTTAMPSVQGTPTVVQTIRCRHCNASNVPNSPACRNRGCAKTDWQPQD